MNKNIGVREIEKMKNTKHTDFLGMFRNFLKARVEEVSQEEEIQNSKIETKKKAELEKALKKAKELENSIFRESARVSAIQGVQVNAKNTKVKLKTADIEEKEKENSNKKDNSLEIGN